MRLQSQKLIPKFFSQMPPQIFLVSELSALIREHRAEWNALGSTTAEIIEFLLEEKLLTKAEFKSKEYAPIIRYIVGRHSPMEFALSLRRDSFLSHGTAIAVHGMRGLGNTIYVNREQSPKPSYGQVTQEGITRAFTSKQRTSKYVLTHGKQKYVLLNGKHTERAGVTTCRAPSAEKVDVTDLERTLLDIVVRPAYAGGIAAVADAYRHFASKVDVDHMLKLLHRCGYAYPYHQSVGFFLQKSGRSTGECGKFAALGINLDFYLDYGMHDPAYNREWRLYYPRSFDRSRPQKD